MRNVFLAAATVLGLGLISSAYAAPVPAGAAMPVATASEATPVAVFVRRRFHGPRCAVTVTRFRGPHGWVTRRVRRCR